MDWIKKLQEMLKTNTEGPAYPPHRLVPCAKGLIGAWNLMTIIVAQRPKRKRKAQSAIQECNAFLTSPDKCINQLKNIPNTGHRITIAGPYSFSKQVHKSP